MLSFDRSRLI